MCAQPAALTGARHAGPGRIDASSAVFKVVLSRAGAAASVPDADTREMVLLQGTIQPETAHVGKAADLFVVHKLEGSGFSMLDATGRFRPWNGHVADLVPATRTQLAPQVQIAIFAGRVNVAGTHLLYLGYRSADGQLHYTSAPHVIAIRESPLDAARRLYTETIAPVILPLCLRCHYAGGPAPDAVHVFAGIESPDHMEFNIAQFRLLLRPPRDKAHVLSKVQGGRTHGGDVVVPANGAEFLALEHFLTLLEAVPDQR